MHHHSQSISAKSPILVLDHVSVMIGKQLVINDISISLKEGEIAALLGPSGSGKTTVLRAIAGLQDISHGSICFDNIAVSTPKKTTVPEKRKVGIVTQDLALFPHLTVSENIAFGLFKFDRSARLQRVNELLAMADLANKTKSFPHQLSGGQQQRLALLRALAPSPKILLLDEVFSGLDSSIKKTLIPEVRHLIQHEKTTAILVSHDIDEAQSFSDLVGTIDSGTMTGLAPWPDN